MIPTEDEFMKCVPPATVQLKKDKLEASSREKINAEDPSGLRTALLYTPSALKESQEVVAAQESSALRAPSSSDGSGVEDIAQLKAALLEAQSALLVSQGTLQVAQPVDAEAAPSAAAGNKSIIEDDSKLRADLVEARAALQELQEKVVALETSTLSPDDVLKDGDVRKLQAELLESRKDYSKLQADLVEARAALQELQEKVVALEAAPSTLSPDDVLKDGDVRKLQADLLGAQCALKEAQEALATQQVPTRSTLLSADARVREDVHDLFVTELPMVLGAEGKPNAEDMASLAETVAKLKIELDESRSALKLLQASVSTWRSKELFHVFCAFDWDDTGYICADELLVTMNTVLTMTLTTTMMKTVDDEYDWCQ
jgi:hypothetical protein